MLKKREGERGASLKSPHPILGVRCKKTSGRNFEARGELREKSWGGKRGQTLNGAQPRFRSSDVGHFLGIAEEFFAGGQTAATFADILDVFELALAVVLFMNLMGVAAIAAGHGFPLGIAQVPGLFR
jgi:hypothetical protein